LRKLLKKGDIVIIAAVLLAAGIMAVTAFIRRDGGCMAVIAEDGEIIGRIDLDKTETPYEIKINGGVLLVEPGAISYVDADCPDHSCIRMGKLRRAGDIAACVPNRTCVYIEGSRDVNSEEGGIDAVTY